MYTYEIKRNNYNFTVNQSYLMRRTVNQSYLMRRTIGNNRRWCCFLNSRNNLIL